MVVWIEILAHIVLLASIRYVYATTRSMTTRFQFAHSRSWTATVDKTTSNQYHDLVLRHFGLTPFLDTFPDFLAGFVVMVPALFVAIGFEVGTELNSEKK